MNRSLGIKITMISFICFIFFRCNTMKSTEEKKPDVTAEVTFLSATGRDPLNKLITSENVKVYLPDERSVDQVGSFFKARDFSFRYDRGISATISGERETFQKLFGVELEFNKGSYKVKGQDNGLNLPLEKLPDEIKERLSNISLPERMELF
ncbi:hypothetical protein RQM65_05595 [Pricia sp. S334]|uniref:Beta-hexosaminidase n=1 Tax=Pricia mediterranea TaxID=3076079 RepID=A0ABU3L3J5_9FLAO|nr:hypothetical protein [Pricia sp. S334]MDT7828138.1 hypothetical protein [Pricia sp. S334]